MGLGSEGGLGEGAGCDCKSSWSRVGEFIFDPLINWNASITFCFISSAISL